MILITSLHHQTRARCVHVVSAYRVFAGPSVVLGQDGDGTCALDGSSVQDDCQNFCLSLVLESLKWEEAGRKVIQQPSA